ncbi:MAG: HD domain-containing protein [Bdellovibrionota bacterium]
MKNSKKFVLKQATRDRCNIIKIDDQTILRRFSPVSSELFHFLYEDHQVDFSLFFRMHDEMVEFLRPREFNKEALDSLWAALNHSSDTLRLYVLKGEKARFDHFIQSIMQKKLQKFKDAGGDVDEKTLSVYGNLSSASQMIVRGGVDAIVAKHAKASTAILLNSQLDSDAATDTISRMINHDPTLYDHSATVAMFSAIIATKFMRNPLDQKSGHIIAQCGLYHDAGKTCVPGHVLNKPGKLDEGEYEIMKTHTNLGREELEKAIKNGADIETIVPLVAYEHHERFCGHGYPLGKRGRAEDDSINGIHLFTRVVTIADVYSALLMKRVYKDSMESDKALAIMMNIAEKEYDPIIFEDFASGIASSIKYRRKRDKEQYGKIRLIGKDESFQKALIERNSEKQKRKKSS